METRKRTKTPKSSYMWEKGWSEEYWDKGILYLVL